MSIDLASANVKKTNPYLSVAYTDGDLFNKYELMNNRIEKLIIEVPEAEGTELFKLRSEFEKIIVEMERITNALRANGYSKQVYNY